MTQRLGKWPWERERDPEDPEPFTGGPGGVMDHPVLPPGPAPVPIPFPARQSALDPAQHTPFALIQEDAIGAIMAFIDEQGPDRGPFKLARDGEQNQQLPGTSLPPWFMQVLNYLAGHPLLPYNHDRPTMVRDLLFMAAAGLVQTLQQYQDSDELKNTQHIIAHESTLRRFLHEEEMLQNHFTEDLAIAARALELRMDAGQREAAFVHLKRLFDFIRAIRDKNFWQPVFLKYTMLVPEIQHAIKYIGEDDKYAHDPEYKAWIDMLNEADQQHRDWDKEYE